MNPHYPPTGPHSWRPPPPGLVPRRKEEYVEHARPSGPFGPGDDQDDPSNIYTVQQHHAVTIDGFSLGQRVKIRTRKPAYQIYNYKKGEIVGFGKWIQTTPGFKFDPPIQFYGAPVEQILLKFRQPIDGLLWQWFEPEELTIMR